MKKLISFLLMCIVALSMNAQRCAVLEFKAGAGISQADVDGISAIFITYFRPAGYTMVERTQIDKAIDEQGFQRSKMTESQMVRIGQILNVSKIVVGDVNVVMGQYNVDVRVINVESGTIAATDGATFTASSYRATMQKVAQNLAGQIAISAGSAVTGSSSQNSKYVDLGLPSGTLWKNQNEAGGHYSYDQAMVKFGNNLPTQDQLNELKNSCQWIWIGNGYKVKGPNGNTIILPAQGVTTCNGITIGVGLHGSYWTSIPYDSEHASRLFFDSSNVNMNYVSRCCGYSVRLVR